MTTFISWNVRIKLKQISICINFAKKLSCLIKKKEDIHTYLTFISIESARNLLCSYAYAEITRSFGFIIIVINIDVNNNIFVTIIGFVQLSIFRKANRWNIKENGINYNGRIIDQKLSNFI